VALLDIDYFKKYNDHYGHQQGDDALKQVANHLKNCIRETDSLYRYGGEEFLILMPETTSQEAMVPLQRIINELGKLSIAHEKSPFEQLTISAGAACSNHQLTGWREVIELADRRLYDAKSRGRNQFCVRDSAGLKVVQAS
jgi:diguanylate cyclase (GGDEF)-like protein